jgi:hypothetical protein
MIDDFLHALSAIPELLIGMWNHPKITITVVFVTILAFAAIQSVKPEPTPIPAMVEVSPPIEPPKEERRIVRFAKWLWDKTP